MVGKWAAAVLVVIAIAVIAAGAVLLSGQSKKGSLDSTFNATDMYLAQGNKTSAYGVYLALTQAQQQQGYMNQTSLGDCKGISPCIGMLFIFSSYSNECFWMENTVLPLRQAWINQSGTITYIYNASPETTKTVCHDGSAVLETSANQALSVGGSIRVLAP